MILEILIVLQIICFGLICFYLGAIWQIRETEKVLRGWKKSLEEWEKDVERYKNLLKQK